MYGFHTLIIMCLASSFIQIHSSRKSSDGRWSSMSVMKITYESVLVRRIWEIRIFEYFLCEVANVCVSLGKCTDPFFECRVRAYHSWSPFLDTRLQPGSLYGQDSTNRKHIPAPQGASGAIAQMVERCFTAFFTTRVRIPVAPFTAL